MIELRWVRQPLELEHLRGLFREYADSLDVDLAFQSFEEELASLPGKYAEPSGRLLLAYRGTEALACAAIRRLDDQTCEVKRLYVRPAGRGHQLGRMLMTRLCQEAKAIGYSRMCLDTLPSMHVAQALYSSLGFKEIAPYVFNPVLGSRFMAIDLTAES
jgi:ribosomal protein S18 acetylase RimI-like enzyme